MGKKKLIFMIAYCFTYIIYGSSFSCLGPLLAFYADASRLPEEEFALMITMRGLGYIIGGFIKLKFLKDLSLHKGMMFGCISAAIGTFLLSSTLNSYLLILYSLWFAISLLFIDVFINICFITIGGDNVKTYINIAFIFNSVGNFAGPTLVSLLGI